MSGADRTVRRLKLTAPSEAAARRLLPTLEDALRCASLPGDDARVLVVRRLALGRVAAGISAQALAAVIERRMAETGVRWVAGGSAEAEGAEGGAECVAFPSALDARIRLALRLVRGSPCAAWYWPRAVAEFEPRAEPVENLGRIVAVVAAWPEAAVALPAWAAAVVAGGGPAAVAALTALAAAPGGADRAATAVLAAPLDAWRPPAGQTGDRGRGASSRPQRAARAVSRAGRRGHATPAAEPAGMAPAVEPRSAPRRRAALAPGPKLPASAAPLPLAAVAPERARLGAHAEPAARTPRHPRQNVRNRHPAAERDPSAPPRRSSPVPPTPAMRLEPAFAERLAEGLPTGCAGLLFLLPVLVRLGLPTWLGGGGGGDDGDAAGFAARVLRHALMRLEVPPGDPAWELATLDRPAPFRPVRAPPTWADPLLAAPRGAIDSAPLAARLAAAADGDAQAAVWLDAARRWLRRAARLGLASLIVRPGRLTLTPTHAELHFRLADADLRVRRAGLDVDPGWLAWFGRVAGFHYDGPDDGLRPALGSNVTANACVGREALESDEPNTPFPSSTPEPDPP